MSLVIVGESDAELTAVLDRLHELGVRDVTRVAGRPVAIVGTRGPGVPSSAAEVASRLGLSKPAPRPHRMTRQQRRYMARKAQKLGRR